MNQEQVEKQVIPPYNALAQRQVCLNTLVWQTPLISLAAQAFLLTLSFSSETLGFYRAFSGLAGFVIGICSFTLFLRHCTLEREISIRLEKLERAYFAEVVSQKPPKVDFDHSYRGIGNCSMRPIWAILLLAISFLGLIPLVHTALAFLL